MKVKGRQEERQEPLFLQLMSGKEKGSCSLCPAGTVALSGVLGVGRDRRGNAGPPSCTETPLELALGLFLASPQLSQE